MQGDSITIDFHGFSTSSQKLESNLCGIAKVRHLQKSQRYKYVTIDGLPCGSFTIRIEDDLEEFLIAYENLERQITTGTLTRHTVFLNDGGFTLVAYMSPTTTKLEISSTPYLNRMLTKNYEVEVSTKDYVAGWRSVLQTLLDATGESS